MRVWPGRPVRPLNIQQAWSYLEPLFMGSQEVKAELSQDTRRFERVDKEVKATLSELWAAKKVVRHACSIQTCISDPGLVIVVCIHEPLAPTLDVPRA